MPTPFPLLKVKGVFSGAEGEGVLSSTNPVGVGHGWNWPRVD